MLISNCYDAAIGCSCDSAGGVDSGEYAGISVGIHHVCRAAIVVVSMLLVDC